MLEPKIGDIAVFSKYGQCPIIGIAKSKKWCAVLVEEGVILDQEYLNNSYKDYGIDLIHLGKRFYNIEISNIISIISMKKNKKIDCKLCSKQVKKSK